MKILVKFFKSFINISINFINNLKRVVIIDKDSYKFLVYNKKTWLSWRKNQNSHIEILVDFYGVAEALISYSYFINILAKKHHAIIKSFGKNEILPNWYLHKIYRSFNVSNHINSFLNYSQKNLQKKIYRENVSKLKTKKDIFNLKIFGIWIGIDIYETYLKRYSKPTIYLDDSKLWETVKEAIGLVIFWKDYFVKHKVASVVISHDCYLHLDIIAKVAYANHVPVYLPNIRGITYTTKPFSVYKYLPKLRKMFKKLTKKEQEDGIAWAKKQLERRFKGEVGVDMSYATKSAFHQEKTIKPVLKINNKIKVLICTHCFYDNPHGYGGMLFLDFYEWLNFLGQISQKTNYDWYLKVHPDPLPGTIENIKMILNQYPKIKIIPHQTSHHQLVKEGIDFVLTVYGTVGHEYPALGVQVINAGYNPHIAYDFNWNPKSINEYKYYLLNLDKLKKKINLNEIYEFYYLYHYYVLADNLILQSYRQSLADLTVKESNGPKIYSYFLNQLTDKKHSEIIKNMQNFIESKKTNYFSHGPED